MKKGEKQFAVIGLGRFGLAICKELQDAGSQVLAVDIDEVRVREVAAFVSQAIVANCTHEETVAELELHDYDMVMIAIGDDVNASILATLIAKESGVRSLWVKANDQFQARVLQKIGADHVIMPERDMGIRVARKMLDRRVLDFHPLGSDLAMTEYVIGSNWMGKTLGELTLCQVEGVQVLGFKRGPEITKAPGMDINLEIGDLLIVVGPQDKLARTLKSL